MRVLSRVVLGLLAYCPVAMAAPEGEAQKTAERVSEGIVVLYDFSSTEGSSVRDVSGHAKSIDLEIADIKKVRRAPGSLEIRGKTTIRSKASPDRLIRALRRSQAVSIEAWVRPAKTDQTGPARIVTLSQNSTQRNFTLGQDGDKFDVRFRSTKTNSNGIPSLSSKPGSLRTALTHVVYTRARDGQARIFINGKQLGARKVAGDLSNWGTKDRLGIANEQDGSRLWLGSYHLVAIYDRNLSKAEVVQNFSAGANANTPLPAHLAVKHDPGTILFETKIAPLLARHCLECHDSGVRKGKLDLSRKDRALAGVRGERVIVPGKLDESSFWEEIESDEMPKKRTPLSAAEKSLVKTWIESGAPWTLDRIDPAVYAHGERIGHDLLRRLTIAEYVETVKAAVGVEVTAEAHKILPPDLRADGFSNTAYNLKVDLKHIGAYGKLAEIVVSRMDVPAFRKRFSKKPRFTDPDMGALISKMGKWLLRGSLEEHEIIAYRGIMTTVVGAGGDFDEATGFVIEAMLQSPRFLYRMEDQRGDGESIPVSDYELATRMSYTIWGGPPDKALLDAAERGDLHGEGIDQQIARMIADRRAAEHSARFLAEWLNLGRLANMKPNEERFPNWTPQLGEDMKRETLAFFEEVVWKQKRPLGELFRADVSFLTPRLAKHYGLDPKKSDEDSDLARYDLSKVPSRGGLLTQGSVLTVGGDEASTVTRGLFLLHELLRGVVNDPPPCLDTTPKPSRPGLTKRAIAMDRVESKTCGGCHVRFEPLAFGLEKFDGLGAHHEKDEHGNKIEDYGEILFPGEDEPRPFKNSGELMDLLAGSDRVKQSLTWKLTQFALGRPLGANDARIVDKIHDSAQKNGGTYASLIAAIVKSDLTRFLRTEEETAE